MVHNKNELKVLKVFLLSVLYRFFCELFQSKIQQHHGIDTMECYTMDSKLIQFLIQEIVKSEEYTLEGIAYHTRIPFDVVYEAACGISNHFSIIPWAKIACLYLQVRPDVGKLLIDKLLELREKGEIDYTSLLSLD